MKNISDQIFQAFLVAATLLALVVIVFGGLERPRAEHRHSASSRSRMSGLSAMHHQTLEAP